MSTNISTNDTDHEQSKNTSAEGFPEALSGQKSDFGAAVEGINEAAKELPVATAWRTGRVAFDYSELGNAADEALAIAERYRSRLDGYVFDTGRDLITMKDKLDHGLFQKWVEAEMGLTARTAQNFMNTAKNLGDKCEIVSHLPLTVVYALAAPSTDPDVRASLLERIGADEMITVEIVKAEARNAREKKAADKKQSKVNWEAERRAKLNDEQRAQEDADKAALEAENVRQQEALAREEQERQQEQREQEDLADAEIARGAALLIKKFGANDFSEFATRHYSSMMKVVDKAIDLVATDQAQETEMVVNKNTMEVKRNVTYKRLGLQERAPGKNTLGFRTSY